MLGYDSRQKSVAVLSAAMGVCPNKFCSFVDKRQNAFFVETYMSMLFVGGRLFDGKTLFEEGLGALVEDGKITRLEAAGEFDGFAGQRIDTTGGTLMPGLIDCHVHLLYSAEADPSTVLEKLPTGQVVLRAMSNALRTLRGGTTSVRDCGGKDYLEFAVRDACNSGEYLGPTIHAAGRMICMTGGHGNRHGRVADGVDDVVRAVREQVHAGCDLIKIMATGGVMTKGVNPEDAHYSAQEMAAGIAEAVRFSRPSASHAQGAEGILNATRGGISSIEHGIFMNDECIAEMLERGTFLVPTVSALVNILNNESKGIPEYIMEKSKRCAEAHRRSIKAFYNAGGKLAMGTDAGTPFNLHGENAMELKFMTDVGVAPLDAMQAATANGAELMRLDNRGRIAVGMAADLLVVDGDPSSDINAVAETSNHRLILKAGRIVERSDAVPIAAT